MRVIVIGGTGHIGSYLIPKLVTAGHEVVCISRQGGETLRENPAWQPLEHIAIDRTTAEEKGNFGERIRELRGAVVIDLDLFYAQ